MKIIKADFLMISICALAGFAFVSFAASAIIPGLIAGIPSGAAGGCFACIARRMAEKRNF